MSHPGTTIFLEEMREQKLERFFNEAEEKERTEVDEDEDDTDREEQQYEAQSSPDYWQPRY